MVKDNFIHGLTLGPMKNRVYLVGDRVRGTCGVVDPAWDADAIIYEAARLQTRITQILCTHAHDDHVNRVKVLHKLTQAPVYMLGIEAAFASFSAPALTLAQPGDVLDVSGTPLRFSHTPGHTPGSTCFALEKLGALITGDTLFVGGCGRCDLPGSDPHAMYRSLRALSQSFDPQTVIFPGHDYGETSTSTLAHECGTNPYLLAPTEQAFVALRMGPAAARS